MRSDMRRALWVFLGTMLAGVATFSIILYFIWSYPDRNDGSSEGLVKITVQRGATAQDVSELLQKAGLIESPALFRLYTAQRGAAGRIRSGNYEVKAPATPKQLVDTLMKGAADRLVSVTIPEGKHFVEIADILDAAGVTRKAEFIAAAINPTLIQSLDIPGQSMEGYLFPDTYRLRPNTPAADVVILMVRRHRQVYAELRAANLEGVEDLRRRLGFEDKQIVILASIVEKETGRPEERPRIAQLNINRLTVPGFSPRKLQTDPTIIYGCTVAPIYMGRISEPCRQFKDMNIRTIHIDDPDNEFNTYAITGLPPGPIANPGRATLRAVMRPDKTPFLYFVAKGGGYHHFSTTLAEHNAAVVKYQLGGRAMPAAATRRR
jgi:UPF0755 protein